MRQTPKSLAPGEPKLGLKVIIQFNPHDGSAQGILGTIVGYRPGAGFAGCDLIDVEYTHPQTGEVATMPFTPEKLIPAEPHALRAMAQRYEAIAAELRILADQAE